MLVRPDGAHLGVDEERQHQESEEEVGGRQAHDEGVGGRLQGALGGHAHAHERVPREHRADEQHASNQRRRARPCQPRSRPRARPASGQQPVRVRGAAVPHGAPAPGARAGAEHRGQRRAANRGVPPLGHAPARLWSRPRPAPAQGGPRGAPPCAQYLLILEFCAGRDGQADECGGPKRRECSEVVAMGRPSIAWCGAGSAPRETNKDGGAARPSPEARGHRRQSHPARPLRASRPSGRPPSPPGVWENVPPRPVPPVAGRPELRLCPPPGGLASTSRAPSCPRLRARPNRRRLARTPAPQQPLVLSPRDHHSQPRPHPLHSWSSRGRLR